MILSNPLDRFTDNELLEFGDAITKVLSNRASLEDSEQVPEKLSDNPGEPECCASCECGVLDDKFFAVAFRDAFVVVHVVLDLGEMCLVVLNPEGPPIPVPSSVLEHEIMFSGDIAPANEA
jgi:hypothetical protein